MRESEVALVIDCLEAHGFLLVTMSGGEPLSHPLFPTIYRTLKNRGFLVTICTNGTLIDEDTVGLFQRYPPFSLEISVYGTTAEQFRRFTGRDAYHRFVSALDLLSAAGIDYSLKMPLTRRSLHFARDVEILARQRNVALRIGTLVYPRLDRDPAPLMERLPVTDVVSYEYSECYDLTSRQPAREPTSELRCSSGRNSIVVDSDCHIAFCGLLREPRFHFSCVRTFSMALTAAAHLRATLEEAYRQGPCSRCAIADCCLCCPAQSWLHTGSLCSCIPYFRDLAEAKRSYRK